MKQETEKSKITIVLLLASIMIFIMGVGIFIYPVVSNYLAEKKQKEAITVYDESVNSKDESELEAEWKLARIYNENLAGDPLHDPFVPGSGFALPDNYMEVLNLNQDGIMGHIEIPKINVYLPIYHGTNEEVLQKGAGHLEGSPIPIGGVPRHSVISAHRGLPSAELFTYLNELEIKDVFYIHILDEVLAYEVDNITVIEPKELSELRSIDGKDLVTLLTCTPYAVNSHRLLVRGSRIPYVEEEAEEIREEMKPTGIPKWMQEYIIAIVIGAAILALVLFLLFGRKRKQGKEEQEYAKKSKDNLT